jgi:hypothetical protein
LSSWTGRVQLGLREGAIAQAAGEAAHADHETFFAIGRERGAAEMMRGICAESRRTDGGRD